MSISRREMEFFVNSHLHSLDDETLVTVAETVLGKTVTMRGRRFSVKKEAPAETPADMGEIPADIREKAIALQSALKRLGPASADATKMIADFILNERRRFDKVLAAADATVTALDLRGNMASAVTTLETALREHGLCLPYREGELTMPVIKEIVEQIAKNEAANNGRTPMTKLTAPQIDVLLDILEGRDRFADRYAPALKVVAIGLANWSGKSSGLSNDRLILTDEGRARAELERTKRKEA
ncbi:hypothetical protein OIU34_21095 [Pararhizobium sp. BT-229]|uniref:hypothetical protein n=1 Tax=Pararhizobium sp. BT-229 TaxID=2986923 RepID=UPI0021F75669|nr:hypothetical protein [Pararhizobium sp. BT-229]MCV9964388.1 hypothetical protein [Pararhizobium sp. BT-229]